MGTLKKIADIGYKYVEHANYVGRKFYGYTPKEFKKILNDHGLDMISGHVEFGLDSWDEAKQAFSDCWKYTIEDALTAGQKYVVTPWMDEGVRTDEEKLKQLLELFNKSGALCQKEGVQFGYHNHDFEFQTKFHGKMLYEIILEQMDKDLVVQEMDIGNMYNGGGNPLEILEAYPDRFEMMHIKDEIKSAHGEMGDDYESTVLGEGILPVKKICKQGKKHGGTSCFIIEQESYQDRSALASAKVDFKMMKKWGY